MKIIDDNMYETLHILRILNGGTNASLGRKLGLSRAYIGRLIDGNVNYFSDKTWNRIEYLFRPHIKKIKEEAKNNLPDVLDCVHLEICPLLSDEDVSILEYFKDKVNKLERYELLAKIERGKNKDKGGDCLEELQADRRIA